MSSRYCFSSSCGASAGAVSGGAGRVGRGGTHPLFGSSSLRAGLFTLGGLRRQTLAPGRTIASRGRAAHFGHSRPRAANCPGDHVDGGALDRAVGDTGLGAVGGRDAGCAHALFRLHGVQLPDAAHAMVRGGLHAWLRGPHLGHCAFHSNSSCARAHWDIQHDCCPMRHVHTCHALRFVPRCSVNKCSCGVACRILSGYSVGRGFSPPNSTVIISPCNATVNARAPAPVAAAGAAKPTDTPCAVLRLTSVPTVAPSAVIGGQWAHSQAGHAAPGTHQAADPTPPPKVAGGRAGEGMQAPCAHVCDRASVPAA